MLKILSLKEKGDQPQRAKEQRIKPEATPHLGAQHPDQSVPCGEQCDRVEPTTARDPLCFVHESARVTARGGPETGCRRRGKQSSRRWQAGSACRHICVAIFTRLRIRLTVIISNNMRRKNEKFQWRVEVLVDHVRIVAVSICYNRSHGTTA